MQFFLLDQTLFKWDPSILISLCRFRHCIIQVTNKLWDLSACNLLLREGEVGLSLLWFSELAMGDAAIIDCSVLTTNQLLVLFQAVSEEVARRLRDAEDSTSEYLFVEPPPSRSSAQSSSAAPPLLQPFRCPYSCRWCTRREGHKYHSCFDHRRRRWWGTVAQSKLVRNLRESRHLSCILGTKTWLLQHSTMLSWTVELWLVRLGTWVSGGWFDAFTFTWF